MSKSLSYLEDGSLSRSSTDSSCMLYDSDGGSWLIKEYWRYFVGSWTGCADARGDFLGCEAKTGRRASLEAAGVLEV